MPIPVVVAAAAAAAAFVHCIKDDSS